MQLRKSRQPLHGRTNRGNLINSPFSQAQLMSQLHVWDKTNSSFVNGIQSTNIETVKEEKTFTRNQKNIERYSQNSSEVLAKLRKVFQGRKNVWRIAKAWKFHEKGYIQKQDLEYQMKNNLKLKFSSDECQDIFNHFSEHQEQLDVEKFLNLIYTQPKDSILKPKLFNISDQQNQRNKKILNLVHPLEKKNKTNSNRYSQCLKKNNLTLNNFSKLNLNNSGEFFNKSHFCTLNSSYDRHHLLNNKIKKQSFDAKNFVELNQKKTRFGATKISENHKIGELSLSRSAYSTVSNTDDEGAVKKSGNEGKLQKIREFRRINKENIEKIETKEKIRQQANLLRRRLDKEAYEYSAFLKNKWE